jgi:hypothetical protein
MTFFLKSEECDADCEQEGFGQGVNRAQDRNVLDQRRVPQEPEDEGR